MGDLDALCTGWDEGHAAGLASAEAGLTVALALGAWARWCHEGHVLSARLKSCNLHTNCAQADTDAAARGRRVIHCRVEDCEDCFGS